MRSSDVPPLTLRSVRESGLELRRSSRRVRRAAAVIVAWIVCGPIFGFSDTWQLVINTATTIVTFLMVFLIQNTQNRESAAIQLKLDELIRASQGAHNGLLDLEELSERELEGFRERYVEMAQAARDEIRRGASDTGTPKIEFHKTR